jgi:modification methylase
MPHRSSAGRRQTPGCTQGGRSRREASDLWRTRDLPLAMWPCAQRTSQWQREGRYVRESNRHPAKMLPEIARRAIEFYSQPEELVLDPMCGIATTLVEAIHQCRCVVGVELEPRWATLATENVTKAEMEGAASEARIVQGDARDLGRGVLDDLTGRVSLILTPPPYGNATLGDPRGGKGMQRARESEGRPLTLADRRHAANARNSCRYGDSAGSVARLRYGKREERSTLGEGGEPESYLAAMAAIYGACARMLRPGGYAVLVTKNLRAEGSLRNLAGDTISLCLQAGLSFQQHIVALLATVRNNELLPRPPTSS